MKAALLLTFVSVFPLFAQVDTAIVMRYPGTSGTWTAEMGLAVAVDAAGNMYVTGSGMPSTSGFTSDCVTIKYLPNGDTAWVRLYAGPAGGDDKGEAIVVDDSGNAYVAASSQGDCLAIKYASDGTVTWMKRVLGNDPAAAALDNNHNFIVTGTGFTDIFTIKFLANGDTAWTRRWNGMGNGDDGANAIGIDGSGNIVVGGSTAGGYTNNDGVTIKYLPNGDTAWTRPYNGLANGYDQVVDIALDNSGNVYATLDTYGYGQENDIGTIKYSTDGNVLWERRYNSPANNLEIPKGVVVNNRGDVYVAGTINFASVPGLNTDFIVIKYAPGGDTAWVRRWNSPWNSYEEAWAMAADSFGNVYVTGRSWNGNDYDWAIAEFDSAGHFVWSGTYAGSLATDDQSNAVACDRNGNVVVTGSAYENVTYNDMVTVKFVRNTTGTPDEQSPNSIPQKALLDQNFPNPFNPETSIRFQIPGNSMVRLVIYDILGREVAVLVNEQQLRGAYEVRFNGSKLASGMYVYRLTAGSIVLSRKMALVR